jgi:hypothetical protein
MPFKHAHSINLTAGEQHHVDVEGRRYGHERHVQASTVPGVTPGAIVAHTHHDVDELVNPETGMLSHHQSGRKPVMANVSAEFDADMLDEERPAAVPATAAAPVSPRRRDLDSE